MEDGRSRPVANHFTEIQVKKPSDLIIAQIRRLISNGVLRPGDRLPSERELAERFGAGRGHVREAIKKLEFYGILKTFPQSGTVVASLGVRILEGLIANVLNLDREEEQSLIEMRIILEVAAARLASERASEEQIQELVGIHQELERHGAAGDWTGLFEFDLLFHLKIAEATQNAVLRSLIGLVAPDIIRMGRSSIGSPLRPIDEILGEHQRILDALRSRQSEAAVKAMDVHMAGYMDARKRRLREESDKV